MESKERDEDKDWSSQRLQIEDLKIWRFEIQPESTILVESQGLLKRVQLLRPIILVPLGPKS
jgi:hypothetical protein